jgi:hypothetical protein
MTKQDKIFIFLIIISLGSITAVVTQNLTAPARTALAERPKNTSTPSLSYDPARSETILKKFENMGLKPHEGKYWK